MNSDYKEMKTFRERFPVLKEWAYLETASTGLIPDFVYEGIKRYQDDRYYKGGDSIWHYDDADVDTLEMIERSKQSIAEMIGAEADEIAFGQSSTQMFTMVTEGIEYGPEDNVVAVGDGWIGNRFAWQKKQDQGLEVRFVQSRNGEVALEDIFSLCDGRTKAVTVNLVESQTGYRMDVEALGKYCDEHDILFFVDGVQALGALKVDVKAANIDFLVGNDYKWMMNYCGTGFAYISKKIFKRIVHWGAGWMSDTNRFDTSKKCLELREDAGRFEIGYPHADGIYGMGLVAQHYNRIGAEKIEKYVCELADYLREQIEALPYVRNTYHFDGKNRCQIASVSVPVELNLKNEDFENAKVYAHLRDSNVEGEREIRVSLHYYNNLEDVDRFVRVLKGAIK